MGYFIWKLIRDVGVNSPGVKKCKSLSALNSKYEFKRNITNDNS